LYEFQNGIIYYDKIISASVVYPRHTLSNYGEKYSVPCGLGMQGMHCRPCRLWWLRSNKTCVQSFTAL